jgi:hypothetical protein
MSPSLTTHVPSSRSVSCDITHHPAVRTVAYGVAIALVGGSLLNSTSWYLAVPYRPMYIMLVGLVVLVLCGRTAQEIGHHQHRCWSWGASVTLVLVTVVMINITQYTHGAFAPYSSGTTAHPAPIHATYHENQVPRTGGGGPIPLPYAERIEEGFAVASDQIEERLEEQKHTTSKMAQSIKGAKINAKAIADAMARFKNIHLQRDTYKERMKHVRDGIRTLKETYATNPEEQSR